MIITKKHLPRRTVLRGLGASLALPLLDSMVPALVAERAAVPAVKRFQADRKSTCLNSSHVSESRMPSSA